MSASMHGVFKSVLTSPTLHYNTPTTLESSICISICKGISVTVHSVFGSSKVFRKKMDRVGILTTFTTTKHLQKKKKDKKKINGSSWLDML